MSSKIRKLHIWDLKELNVLMHGGMVVEPFNMWPVGNCGHVYPANNQKAKRHLSGWAMRNTNNHNINILKKSCLGVLVCNRVCRKANGSVVAVRPAICDKARRKQIGRKCPNGCGGQLVMQACKGHNGYPVTHFWRHYEDKVFFVGKGNHDHPRPEAKLSSEKRKAYNKNPNRITRNQKSVLSTPAAIRTTTASNNSPSCNIYYAPPPVTSAAGAITRPEYGTGPSSFLTEKYMAQVNQLQQMPSQLPSVRSAVDSYPQAPTPTYHYQRSSSWSTVPDYYTSLHQAQSFLPDGYGGVSSYPFWSSTAHTQTPSGSSQTDDQLYLLYPAASAGSTPSSYYPDQPSVNVPLDFSVTRQRNYTPYPTAEDVVQLSNSWRSDDTGFSYQHKLHQDHFYDSSHFAHTPQPVIPTSSSASYDFSHQTHSSVSSHEATIPPTARHHGLVFSDTKISVSQPEASLRLPSITCKSTLQSSTYPITNEPAYTFATTEVAGDDITSPVEEHQNEIQTANVPRKLQGLKHAHVMEIDDIDMGDITNIISIPVPERVDIKQATQSLHEFHGANNSSVSYEDQQNTNSLPALSSFLKGIDYL